MDSELQQIELGPGEKKRWYILFVFCMLSAFQSNIWFTFSSVPDQVEEYYNLHKPSDTSQVNPTIDLLLNWGPIMFLPATPFVGYLLLFPIVGLKYTVRSATTLCFIGSIIRMIPTIIEIFDTQYIMNESSLYYVHIGQILNGLAGPMVLSPPSKLSVIWFPESQRVFATALASGSNTFGTCIGFLLGPYIVTKSSDLPKLLIIDTILIFIPFILSWIYFPNSPNKLPSIAAHRSLYAVQQQMEKEQKHRNINSIDDMEQCLVKKDKETTKNDVKSNEIEKLSIVQHLKNFGYEFKNLLTSFDVVMIGIIGGLAGGIFAGYGGVLQDMLSPLGLNDTQIGFIGFNLSCMTAIGGTFIGPIADRFFNKKLKLLLIILYIIIIINLCILFLVLPSPFSSKSLILINDQSTMIYKEVLLNVLIGSLGFFNGCLVPPFFEVIAEKSYPINEGSSGLYLVTINCMGVLIFIGIGSWLNTTWETFLVTIICIISVCLFTFIKEEYKRP